MIDISIVLAALGMDGPNLVAGFIGGLISCFFAKTLTSREVCGTVLAGTFLPAYGASAVADLAHLPHVLTALLLGFGGIAALQTAYSRFVKTVGGEQKNVGP